MCINYIRIGKLLAHKSLCTNESYKNTLVTKSFDFFKVNLKIIENAWEKFPNEDEYDSRLDFLSKNSDKKFNAYFKTLKNNFNLHFQVMSKKSLE